MGSPESHYLFLRDPFTVSSRGIRQLKKRVEFYADSDARDVKRERNGKILLLGKLMLSST